HTIVCSLSTDHYLLHSSSATIPPFFFHTSCHHQHLHSFPTRRSSDLFDQPKSWRWSSGSSFEKNSEKPSTRSAFVTRMKTGKRIDRKSTRLNSSHVAISYAVFCLKKKRM